MKMKSKKISTNLYSKGVWANPRTPSGCPTDSLLTSLGKMDDWGSTFRLFRDHNSNVAALKYLPVHRYNAVFFFFLHFLVFWDYRVQYFIWEQNCAQPGARRRERCCICHYLSWTDSIKPSLLFSNFGCCISKGSPFRLFRDHSSCHCVVLRP